MDNSARFHADSIKGKKIHANLTKDQINQIYASEADALNMAMLSKTDISQMKSLTQKKTLKN